MRDINKLIIDFLPEENRAALAAELRSLESINNSTYIRVESRQQVLTLLTNLIPYTDELVLQIVAHGTCYGFGLNRDEFVHYSEIAPTLRLVNQSTQNRLILNLQTVCCSKYQLEFFNQSPHRLFSLLIGCTKGAFVHGSILHSIDINNAEFTALNDLLDQMNENLDEHYSPDLPETITYFITH